VRAMSLKLLPLASVACMAVLTAACSDFITQDRSSVTLIIDALEAASGAQDSPKFAGTLQSDVDTGGTVFSDSGRVTMRLIMKDPAEIGTAVNAVTINRYRVEFRRADGRRTPGVDVPHPFDSAITFTVAPGSTVTAGFELIRHVAKLEAPLLGLTNNPVIISTVADVTFFGRDQAGRELSTSGSIGIQFGNFADPD
jgi:hypothetical protein